MENSEKPVVTVVGSFAVGMSIRAPRFPVPGETLSGSDFDMGPGGKGSNQAVGPARGGAESHLVAKIGHDPLGDMALRLYDEENVGTEFLFRTGERPTGVGLITLNAAGGNHIVIDLGANHLLSPADVDAAVPLLARSRVVATVLEIPVPTAARAMALARRHGAMALLNPAPAAGPLPDDLLAAVDILTPNESELRLLSGLAPDDPTDTVTVARRLQQRGVRNLIVTRGALVLSADGDTAEVPGVPVENVVETTGAGDAFNSALAVALAEGKALAEAVRFAACAGAWACTRLGVIPSLPTRDEVAALCASARGATA